MPKVEDKLRIIHMKGEEHYKGREGVIECIDDIGQLHGTWGGLAVVPEEDDYEVISHEVQHLQ